jgi:monovalent cation:proton antiporter-2 (CPA2) family protein
MLLYAAIFLAASVVAVALFKRLGLGSVLGYLAAGALIGPTGLGLIHEVEAVLHFAEFGVVLLLFLIGLELEPSRLWRMRSTVFGLGGAQVGITAIVIGGIAMMLGTPPAAAIVVGVGLAMSSTAFATQLLGERGELGTEHGRSAFGVLLFQDLVAIPILALIPMLGTATHVEGDGHGTAAGWPALLAIVGLVVGGRLLLRPAFRLVAQARSHELSAAAALLVVVGTALVMQSVGLSMALGAFLAGVLLADSEYRHELEADIEPFKGLLLGLFFVAVGMSANLGLLVEKPLVVLPLVVALVAVKGLVLLGIGKVSGCRSSGSTGLAATISQGGEFAFVMFNVALVAGVMRPELVELLVLVVTLSMVLTPGAFALRDAWEKRGGAAVGVREFDVIDAEGSKVIIAGFGRWGQVVGRLLRTRRIPYTALDASAQHVDFVRQYGNKIFYGDAARVDLLRAAKADEAAVFVLAIDDPEASMRVLHTVQENFPHLKIVARARNRQHAYALLGAGVEEVIRETFAGSLEASRVVLEAMGTAPGTVEATIRRFAEYDEAAVRRTYVHRDDTKKLIESAKFYATELQQIFDQDEAS